MNLSFLNLKKLINRPKRFILNSGKNNKYLLDKNITKIEGNYTDYNIHLSIKGKKLKKYSNKNFAIFLEAPTPLREGDTYITKDEKDIWGDPKTWFKNLNSFFDFVEKKLNVKILIAPHPKIKHKSSKPSYYNGRKIINHELAEIAKYSNFHFKIKFSNELCCDKHEACHFYNK